MKFSTEVLPPTRSLPRRLMPEPERTNARMLMELPKVPKPATEIALPMRAKLRMDIDEAMWTYWITDMLQQEPAATMPTAVRRCR